MIEYRIYGTHCRDEMINDIVKSLKGNCKVYYDDRAGYKDPKCACLYTCKKAFTDKWDANVTHICALQDDVLLCNGFTNIIEQIVAAHPDKIICLFPYDHLEKSEYANNLTTPYLGINTNTGQGIVMPVQYINNCFDFIKLKTNDNIEEAAGIMYFADKHKIPIITTIPSTLQHIGDDSSLFPNAKIRRTPYFSMDPVADWSCKEVAKRPALKERIFTK